MIAQDFSHLARVVFEKFSTWNLEGTNSVSGLSLAVSMLPEGFRVIFDVVNKLFSFVLWLVSSIAISLVFIKPSHLES